MAIIHVSGSSKNNTKRATDASEAVKAEMRAAAARLKGEYDEFLAPAAQRMDARRADGELLRAARVRRGGAGIVHSNPLDHMLESGFRREAKGQPALITTLHVAAMERLARDYELVGRGIGIAGVDLTQTYSKSNRVPTEQAGHSQLRQQVKMQDGVAAAAAFLGTLWPVIRDVGLEGCSVMVWGEKHGIERHAVTGYMRAALDQLVLFYGDSLRDPGRVKREGGRQARESRWA